ncbi:hypothetical protein C7271_22405 [filamentous cyanobacterium CCP5]|nr:hypothetical protein C7271_22405 [filamentous cyanobacterium CCP5]
MATVAEALQLAVQHQKAHRWGQAEQIYRQILAQQPGHPDGLHGLSLLAQQQARYPQAERILQSLIKSQPLSFKAWFSLGNVHQLQGQLLEAESAYHQAIALKPQVAALYNNLGYTLYLQGRLEAAIEQYHRALKHQPEFPEVQVNLAQAMADLGQLPSELRVRCAALSHSLGRSRRQAGDWSGAAAYFRQSTRFQPDWAVAQYDLGVALQATGQLDAAVPCFRRVLAANDQGAEPYQILAEQKLGYGPAGQTARLKVAVICQPFVMTQFPQPADSIGILTYELVRRLAQSCDVVVYTAGPQRHEAFHGGVCYRYLPVTSDQTWLRRLERVPGLFTSGHPSFGSSLYYRGFADAVAQDLQQHPVDVVHIHNLAQFAPVIRRRNPNSQIVLHMHCEWLKQLPQSGLETHLGCVDRVIAPSAYIVSQVQQRFPQMAERCLVLPNGVDVDRYWPAPAAPAPRSEKHLLYVGRVCPEKGIHTLLEAFERVLDEEPLARLTLVGPVGVIPYDYLVGLSDDPRVAALAPFHQPDAWSDYLRRYMHRIGDRDDNPMANPVTFTGLVAPAELPRFYQRSDLFVFPSVCHEAFGLPIAEAMVAGLPVVASTGGAFPELVVPGETGLLVERGDPTALAEALLTLLGNAEICQRLGRTGQIRALNHYSFDQMTNGLLKIYQGLQPLA